MLNGIMYGPVGKLRVIQRVMQKASSKKKKKKEKKRKKENKQCMYCGMEYEGMTHTAIARQRKHI